MRLILLVTVLLCACKTQKTENISEPKPVSVLVAKPRMCDVPIFIEALGTLKPSATLEVRSQLKGVLKEILVQEGQNVEKGQVLFQIDPKGFECKVKQAEAQVALHNAELFAYSKKLERYRALVSKDLIAQAEWDALESDVEKAKAQVALMQARLQEAQIDLEHSVIKSSIVGRVGRLDLRPGHLVNESTLLTTIHSLDPLIAEFGVTEKEFPKVLAKEVHIQPLCAENLETTGLICFIENGFDQKSAKICMHACVQNPDIQFRPGHSVNVKIPVSVIQNACVILHRCVQHTPQGPCLYIVQEDNTVLVRPVVLGEALDEEIIVKEGLDVKDVVISDGHARLSQGTKVKIQS